METETFGDRFAGLHRLEPGAPLLIQASSVHGWGLKQTFRAIGLDADLVVLGHAVVRPWRLVWFPGSAYVLELPIGLQPPPTGAQLEMTGV